MKILVLVGHPDSQSFNAELADAYAEGAKEREHEVRRVNLGDLKFDPILHRGYKDIQDLEPDLKELQESIKWCQHFVILYPSWWSTMPALLKSLFDRIWLPGFAFHFHKSGYWWDGLLKGRTARVFVTSDAHPLLARIIFGDTTNEIRKGTLWFAGFKVKVKKIGPLKDTDPGAVSWECSKKKRSKWIKKMKNWGRKAY